MVSLYLGEDAFLGSHEIGNDAQFRFSSCKGFLLPPHPQVISPVSRKRFARSSAGALILVNCSGYAREERLYFFSPNQLRVIRDKSAPSPCLCFINQAGDHVSSGRMADIALSGVCSHGLWLWALSGRHSFTVGDCGEYRVYV